MYACLHQRADGTLHWPTPQIPDKRTEEVDDKDVDRSDENPLKPQFWGLIWDDLQSVSWPSLKQVLQTLYISQLSFVAIIILVVVFDTFTEASVRWLVLGDPPTCAARPLRAPRALRAPRDPRAPRAPFTWLTARVAAVCVRSKTLETIINSKFNSGP